MNLTVKQRQNVRSAFESILRADYISISDLEALSKLEKYYVDTFNNVSSLLQRQDNYISGRRGTGKTALLFRGYYECLKTISPNIHEGSEYFGDKKILPIYIDLSNCKEIFHENENTDLIETNFVRRIIQSLKSQLNNMYDEKHFLVFKKENPALDDLDFIETALINGLIKKNDMKISIHSKEKEKESAKISAALTLSNIGVTGNVSDEQEFETQTSYNQVKGLDIQSFLEKIDEIRRKAGISDIYVFIDEFSDLNYDEQVKLSILIKKILGSKINMYFKISVITDRFNFGDNIRIGRDLFSIPLDLNEYVERYGGIVITIKRMQQFMEILIEKRLQLFCDDVKYEDIFKVKKDVLFYRVAREAMGVPRSIGLIFQNAWLQADSQYDDKKIGLQELNYGITSTRRTYFKQFQGAVKSKLLPGFYMDLWSDIIQKAVSEKNKNPSRPASHILIDPIRKDYMNILCENFLVHFLEENRSSKYGGNYNLYCLDYDICLENNIRFAEDKDEFTAVRFIYDSVLSKYDGYFVKDRLKSYKCDICGRIYDENEVSKAKIKRCFEDDTILKEIIHKEVPISSGNYAEVEIKILGLISNLNEEDAMSAQEIADAVGCSRQKVSTWGSRVLYKNKLINIIQRDNKNYYFSKE